MIRLGIFLRYTGFSLLFILCFAVMFIFLVLAVVGITAGAMLAVLGVAMIMFKADFIITALAPELMLFGGLTAASFTAFLGLTAVKLGFWICRLYVKLERRCSRILETRKLSEAQNREDPEAQEDQEDLPDLREPQD